MGRLGFNFTGINQKGIDCENNSVLVIDDEEDNVLNGSKSPCQADLNKKKYLILFISISIFIFFCIFVVIPHVIDHYTGKNGLPMNINERQTIIELLDTEKLRRYRERLDILEKFDVLQKSYEVLKAKYENAKENYLAKLHGSGV